MADMPLPTAALHDWVVQLFDAAGSSPDEARLAADHLVGANLAGHDSHGVGMIPMYVDALLADELKLNRRVEVALDAGAMLIVDGCRGLGQSVAHQAMALAIERARAHGVVLMGLRNAHHIGRVGHWAEQAIAAGMGSVHFTNAISQGLKVAPYGGMDSRLQTNPFTVGFPVPGGEPVVLDYATSAIAVGKVRVAYNKGERVAAGCLIDADGQPSTDPGVIFGPARGGALRTFAGHKGHALAMVCELLGAALTGGETARPENRKMRYATWNNMLVIVFDPQRLGTAERFGAETRAFVDWVRSARLSGEVDRIMVPGEPERRMRAERAARLALDPTTLGQLDEAAAKIAAARGRGPGPLSDRTGA